MATVPFVCVFASAGDAPHNNACNNKLETLLIMDGAGWRGVQGFRG